MKMTPEQIDELIYDTQGTCVDINFICERNFGHEIGDYENETDICIAVDNAIFECAQCGWWFECGYWNTNIGEQTGENVCLDCEPQEY